MLRQNCSVFDEAACARELELSFETDNSTLHSYDIVLSEGERGGDSMIRKDVIFAILTTFCLCALMFTVIPIRSQEPYDPWADIDENGKINMYDIGYTAQRFGATGDPTKNVNVTNWPDATNQIVWWLQQTSNTQLLTSPSYPANGFCQLHVCAEIESVPFLGTVTVQVLTLINPPGQGGYPCLAYTCTLTNSSTTIAFSIPVPAQSFYFQAIGNNANNPSLCLSYYLTWAGASTSGDPTLNVSVTSMPYVVQTVTENISSNGESPLPIQIFCGGYSRLSVLLSINNASIGSSSSITLFLDRLVWKGYSARGLPYTGSSEQLNKNAFNVTIVSDASGHFLGYNGELSYMTETKAPYFFLVFVYVAPLGVNVPANWWVTFDYSVYLRND
jgi:hypothetical protein